MMRTTRLGNTSLEISRIGLGTWALGGGDWGLGWGAQDDADSIAAIHRAVELGVNWVDTAAVYGLGHSEEVVSRALADIPATDRPLVFTKCGLPWNESRTVRHSLEPRSLRLELESSLRRLRVEAIDLYQIHWPIYPPELPAPDIERAFGTLESFVRDGKVRWIGVSNFDVPQLKRVEAITPVSSLQSPYSLLRTEIAMEILPYALSRGIGVLAYSPLQSGLLTGKMTRRRIAELPSNDWRRARSADYQEPQLSRNLERVERLRAVAADLPASPAQVAVAWALRHPGVTGTIVGARRPDQIEELLPAAELALSDEQARAIER